MADQSKRRFKDETGNRYDRLTVLRLAEMREGQAFFDCRCECGREVLVKGANLRSGNTTSCGCSRRKPMPKVRGSIQMKNLCGQRVWGRVEDPTSKKIVCVTTCMSCQRLRFCYTEERLRKRRGLRCKCYGPTYNSWRKMIERCTNTNYHQYADYGGRGITVCPRWRRSFWAFVGAIGTRPTGKTLDRIDNDKGYYAENCRWATKEQQARNRRKPRKRQDVNASVLVG
jgi:hypothetical protein